MRYLSSFEIAVTIMGIIWFVFGFFFRKETNSKPLISGICTSTSAKSISSFQQIFKASLGSVLVTIFIFSISSSSAVRLIIFSILSSTINIFIFFIIANLNTILSQLLDVVFNFLNAQNAFLCIELNSCFRHNGNFSRRRVLYKSRPAVSFYH
ncbi:hypothetical protein D3C72_937080 [compost metagenome]